MHRAESPGCSIGGHGAGWRVILGTAAGRHPSLPLITAFLSSTLIICQNPANKNLLRMACHCSAHSWSKYGHLVVLHFVCHTLIGLDRFIFLMEMQFHEIPIIFDITLERTASSAIVDTQVRYTRSRTASSWVAGTCLVVGNSYAKPWMPRHHCKPQLA